MDLSTAQLPLSISFAPDGRWFIFDATGATVKTNLIDKAAAVRWIIEMRLLA